MHNWSRAWDEGTGRGRRAGLPAHFVSGAGSIPLPQLSSLCKMQAAAGRALVIEAESRDADRKDGQCGSRNGPRREEVCTWAEDPVPCTSTP